MVNIAVLGFGVVGSGVVEVINKNNSSITGKAGKQISVKKILDIRDFDDSPYKELITKNADEIFEDNSIGVIVETIGGIGIAYEFTKRAFMLGKHVVTSNKELVATHGPELLRLAKQNNVSYLFEASVGGGIPIIRPLYQCLSANEILSITGILNGTTNYILTKMKKEYMGFDVALKNAQNNGYAEADPTSDIEGHDSCRKIAILSSIAYNQYVDYRKIRTTGITKISLSDFLHAEKMGCVVKLIAMSKKVGDKIYARVSPFIINKTHALSTVEDVFNAIVVNGDAIGEAMFYGRGAGKFPTASAVVADIVDIVKHIDNNINNEWVVSDSDNMIDERKVEFRHFIRLKVNNPDEAKRELNMVFHSVGFVRLTDSDPEDEFAFVTARRSEHQLEGELKRLIKCECIGELISVLPILDH